jgi:hypothetical protein
MIEYNILRMCRHSIAFVLYCIHEKYKYNMLFMYTQRMQLYCTVYYACMYFPYILLRLAGEVLKLYAYTYVLCSMVDRTHSTVPV